MHRDRQSLWNATARVLYVREVDANVRTSPRLGRHVRWVPDPRPVIAWLDDIPGPGGWAGWPSTPTGGPDGGNEGDWLLPRSRHLVAMPRLIPGDARPTPLRRQHRGGPPVNGTPGSARRAMMSCCGWRTLLRRRTLQSFAAVATQRRSAGRLRNRSYCQHCKSDGGGGDERGDER